MPFRSRRFLLLAVAFLFAAAAFAADVPDRSVERGFPLITIFGQRQHQGGPQTFGVAQDDRGILYFGNLGGVLTFDGASWRTIKLPNESAAFSIASDASQRILIGGVGEFGYLAKGSGGSTSYQSLVPLVPESQRDFGDVNGICQADGGTIFATNRFLFFWSGNAPKVVGEFPEASTEHHCYRVGGTTYVTGEDGLRPIDRATGTLGAPLAAFAGRSVELVLPGDADRPIVASTHDGLFTFEAGVATPFAPAVSQWLKGKFLTGGCRLPDRRLVITTREDGLVIFRPDGALDQIIDQKAGLPEDVLSKPFADREGSLWLAFHGPIARVDLSSPVTILDSRRGVRGSVLGVARFNGRLYIATSHGVFYFENGASKSGEPSVGAMSHRMEGLPVSAWSLLAAADSLLVGTDDGLYVVGADNRPKIVDGTKKLFIYEAVVSTSDPTRVWLGTRTGLACVRHREGKWVFERAIPGSKPYVVSVIERGGAVWCGTVFNGVMRVDDVDAPQPKIKLFYDGEEINVFDIGGRLVVIRPGGVLMQVGPNGNFVPDTILGRIRVPDSFFLLAEDARGDVWLNTIPPRLAVRRADGTFEQETQPLVQVDATDIQFLSADDDGIVWFGGDHGLYRYEQSSADRTYLQPAPIVRRVIAAHDKVLYGGDRPTPDSPVLPYNFGRLRIEFAPATYRPGVMYQYRLDPIDTEWSRWTSEPFVDYTNLSEERYTMRIRARGEGGNVSGETRWSFTVRPPWYRARWMILLWIMLGAAAIAAIVVWRTARFRRQAEALTEKIASRTEELRSTVDQLKEAQASLVEKNAELENANVRLERLSLVDDLTGVFNRRYFQRALTDEWNRARRRQHSLALVLLDLDHFKELNDRHGHPAGDECLREVGSFLGRTIRRAGDVVARYGGEEFAILLPTADVEQATRVAEMLRTGIEMLGMPYDTGDGRHMTTSCGVAVMTPGDEQTMDALVDAADRAMYVAKDSGRNCVRVAETATTSVN